MLELSEVVITAKDMDEHGCFYCPKCKELVNPDAEETYEVIEVDGECGANGIYSVTIRHKCGQVIVIEVK